MTYFTDYLIQKKITTQEKIIEAVIKQISTLPSPLQIMNESKLLTPEQIITVINTQHSHQIDFVSACKKNDFWTSEIESKFQQSLSKHKKPIGEILVETGAVELKTLVKCLDEFLSQAQPPTQQKINTQSNNLNTESKSTLNLTGFSELNEFFNESKLDEFINLVQLVRQNITTKEIAKEFLQDILKNLQTLKGFARFSQAFEFEKLTTLGVEELSFYLSSNRLGEESYGLQLTNHFIELLKVLFEFKISILSEKTENTFISNDVSKNKLSNLNKNHNELMKTQGAA